MKHIRQHLLGAFVCLATLLFAGCSQVATPIAHEGAEEIEAEALVYDWTDTSSNRGPINGSGALGDLRWAVARNGLGPVERNTNNGGRTAGDGTTMIMKNGVYAGATFTSGLGVYANSSITFRLQGRCSVFTSYYGLDKTASDDARVAFIVYADGQKVFEDRNNGSFRFEEGVAGVDRLTLIVRDLNPRAKNKSANWGNPSIACTTPEEGPWTDTSSNRGPVKFEPSPGGVGVWAQLGKSLWVSATNGRGPVKRENTDLDVYANSEITFDVSQGCVGKDMILSTRLDRRPNPNPRLSNAIGNIYVSDSLGDNRLIRSIDLRVNPIGGVVQIGNLIDVRTLKFTVIDVDSDRTDEDYFWASPTISC